MLMVLAVIGTMHLEGDVTVADGDYIDVAFEVPAGTHEIEIAHTDGSEQVILDWGASGPHGVRGWGGGLVENAIISDVQSSRAYVTGPIEPGTWSVIVGKADLAGGTSGHYAIDITLRDAATLPAQPRGTFQAPVLSTERRWYKGDFHVHSRESGDAVASLQANIDLAHSRGIDFINASDHNTISHHALIAAQQASWPVLAMRGAEITTYSGHANAVGIRDYVDHRLGYKGRTIADVAHDVAAQGGILIVNHPATDLAAACIGCAWKHVDDMPWDQVAGMEILTAGYAFGELSYTPKVIALWDKLEDQGHRLSALSGSDDHTAGIDEGSVGAPVGSPTSLVLADQLSEAAIIDAVRKHRTMVQLRGPDDPMVEFHARTKTGAMAEIGDDVDGVADVALPVRVTGGAGMFVQVWRDGAQLAEKPIDSGDFSTTFEDAPAPGDHRYRVEIVDNGNHRVVVTSHIYVHAVKGSDGGCSTSRGGALALGWLFAALALVRRRSALTR